jgi:hypothetical protein
MPDDREWSYGKRSGTPRVMGKVTSGSSGDTAVLVEEPQPNDPRNLSERPEWKLACRVAASKGLSKSDLLPKFLQYVCEQQLLGNAHEITEQRIGTQIFNRAPDYNPGEDNIVRSYARLLRKRLDEYFEGEGRDEPMRIVIPRGGYVPVFQQEPAIESQAPPSSLGDSLAPIQLSAKLPDTAEIPKPVAAARRVSTGFALAIGLVAGVLLTWTVRFAVHKMQDTKVLGPAHPIWAQLFQPNRNMLIVPSDSGLGVLQNITGHLVTLEEYASGTYLTDTKPVPMLSVGNMNDLRQQRYTSVVSLNITNTLTQLPEFTPSRTQIRYARSITAEDLKRSNVILLGSVHTNPWVALFEKNLNFKFEYTSEVDQSYVLNDHPLGTEQQRYSNGIGGTTNRTYGAIDYLPSLDGKGHVLIIQGLNMAATQAAADILSNPAEMKPVLKQALLPDGSLKSFEFLVETSSIGANDPGGHIIATRFYQ